MASCGRAWGIGWWASRIGGSRPRAGYVVIDEDRGTTLRTPCCGCRHLRRGRACDAFPDLIPLPIWRGEHEHQLPYPGDHGIRLEPRTEAQVAAVQKQIERLRRQREQAVGQRSEAPAAVGADEGDLG